MGQPRLSAETDLLADAVQRRHIRVFVSSAFRDMHAEREELVKRTFPGLRKFCEARGLTWSEVDLRWGVTEEAVSQHRAAEICLREVDRCKPFFIGILGEQYGELTETEIEQGAMGTSPNPFARFYFRAGRGAEPLEKLKHRIRCSGLRIREGYRSPQELGGWIREDYEQLIDTIFPPEGEPDSEAAEQAAFAASRTAVFVERPELTSALYDHLHTGQRPLVITGESGSGKSALLAWWTAKVAREHPEMLVRFHSVGASRFSADWRILLRRVITELGGDVPRETAVPYWRNAFGKALDRAAAERPVLVSIDALNQLEDLDSAQDLPWLPESFAGNVRIQLSTLAGRCLTEALRRQFQALTVRDLTVPEKEMISVEYLRRYGKELTEARLRVMTSAEATGNALFLRALLDELRQFGSYLRLDERIGSYLQARSAEDLYSMILARYEEDYEQGRPGLVRDVCSALLAARRGLSEAEILDVLGSEDGPLANLYWSPLFLAAESSLVTRSGVLTFAHQHIRNAALNRYFGGKEAHSRLADYFASVDAGRRRAEELPWQLSRAGRWNELVDLLTDPPFLADVWAVDRMDLQRYWSALEAEGGKSRAAAYRPFTANPERLGRYAIFVTNFLEASGYPEEALSIYEYLVERTTDPADRAGVIGNVAILKKRTGHLDEALELHRREEQIYRELNDAAGLENCLGHQALILALKGQLEEALDLHKQEETIARTHNHYASLAACLGNQASIHRRRGRFDEALALMLEEERLFRLVGDRTGVEDALFDQAVVFWEKGELERGLHLFEDREKDARDRGDRRWLQKAIGMQAVVHQSVGRFIRALELFETQARICEEIHEWESLQSALNNSGRMLAKLRRNAEALERFQDVERRAREQGHLGLLAVCLQNQGEVYLEQEDVGRALELFREQQKICEQTGDLPGLCASLGTQGVAMQKLELLFEAMELHKAEEALGRSLGDPEALQISFFNQARVLKAAGDLTGALALLTASEQIASQIGATDGLRLSVGERAAIHEQLGDFESAVTLFRKQRGIARQLGNSYGERAALVEEVSVLVRTGDAEGALSCFIELEALAPGPLEQATEAANQAAVLSELERDAEAADAARRALHLLAEAQDDDRAESVRNLAMEILEELHS